MSVKRTPKVFCLNKSMVDTGVGYGSVKYIGMWKATTHINVRRAVRLWGHRRNIREPYKLVLVDYRLFVGIHGSQVSDMCRITPRKSKDWHPTPTSHSFVKVSTDLRGCLVNLFNSKHATNWPLVNTYGLICIWVSVILL